MGWSKASTALTYSLPFLSALTANSLYAPPRGAKQAPEKKKSKSACVLLVNPFIHRTALRLSERNTSNHVESGGLRHMYATAAQVQCYIHQKGGAVTYTPH